MTEAEKLMVKAFMERYEGALQMWEVGFILAVNNPKLKVRGDINRAVVESAIAVGVCPQRVEEALQKAHEEDYLRWL